MEWALTILLCAAILLLILSFSASRKASEKQERDNEMLTASIMGEVKQLQERIRDIEFDTQIIAEEAHLKSTSEQRLILREVLDLYNRKYSIESIASKTEMSEQEVERLLAPYKATLRKGRNEANES